MATIAVTETELDSHLIKEHTAQVQSFLHEDLLQSYSQKGKS
jgi:hypothetical protein